MNRATALACFFLSATIGCVSSNEQLFAKTSATTAYYTETYEHRCQNTGHPPTPCKPCEDAINEAVWQAKVAELNKTQGYLPPAEIADLQRLIVELSKCP